MATRPGSPVCAAAVLAACLTLAAGCRPTSPDPSAVLPVYPGAARSQSGEWLFVAGRDVPGGEHHVAFWTSRDPLETVATFYRDAIVPGLGRPRALPARERGVRSRAFVWPRDRGGRTWFVDVLRPDPGSPTVIALGWAR